MVFFCVMCIVLLSPFFCSSQKAKETITSYTESFKSDIKHGKVLEVLKNPQSKISCAMKCLRKSFCTTAIIDEVGDVCFLSKMRKHDQEKLEKRALHYSQSSRFSHIQLLGPEVGKEYAYLEVSRVRDSVIVYPVPVPYKYNVFKNCRDLKILHPDARSGVFWIKPVSIQIDKPFKAFCDQATSGGGWTLVWTYTFTDYTNFDSLRNAVTPLPKWNRVQRPPGRVCQPESETTPLSEQDTGAMLFSLWSKIGDEFLVKSNIMNWVSCVPIMGNLVQNRQGSIKCHVVRNVIGRCGDIVPTMLMRRGPMCGPKLVARRRVGPPPPPLHRCSSAYIDFNGDALRGWPVHDSCGQCKPTQLKGVAMPRGNVFIR